MNIVINDKNIELLNSGDLLHKYGEFGVHDGFFNTIAVIDGVEYYFQCCMNSDDVYCSSTDEYNYSNFDFYESGYDDGICGDVNEPLAKIVGWENIPKLLKIAAENY